MRPQPPSVIETLEKDQRVFERLADEFDRARLRDSVDMRRQVLAALDVVEPALAAHRALEAAAVEGRTAKRPPQWRQAVAAAELQRDLISGLAKDTRILASDPARYRLEHLAALSFKLSSALRAHLVHDEAKLWKSLTLEGAPAAAALAALRRVEAMLGRL